MTNNRNKILIVEDDVNIRSIIRTLLESNSYQAICASSYNEGITLFYSYQPDVVILDLGLPDRDGTEFIDEVRKRYLVPILVLSARGADRDKVTALDKGANDYVTKPFSSPELLARLRALLRTNQHRAESGKLPSGIFTSGSLTIDYNARRIFYGEDEVKLTQTEYNILAFLSESPGKMMTYSSIIKGVWGQSDEGSIKKLQVNMANIRKKFGIRIGEEWFISNELGVGYRFNSNS